MVSPMVDDRKGGVVMCRNLRPAVGGGLVPVGLPVRAVEECVDEVRRPAVPQGSLVMTAALSTTATVAIAGRTLAGEYTSREGRLTDDDITSLGRDVVSGLKRASAMLMSRGYVVGPVIGRCVARDRQGREVVSSPPLLLHNPAGGSGLPSVSARVTGSGGYFRAMESTSLSLGGLSVSVALGADMDDATAARIDTVELLMTPSLAAMDLAADIDGVVTDYDGTACRLAVTMPGVARGGELEAARRRVEAALDHLPALERIVARVDGRELRQGSVTVAITARESLARQIAAVDKALQTAPVVAVDAGDIVREAHVTARMGDLLMAGDIEERHADGWSPAAFMTGGKATGSDATCFSEATLVTAGGEYVTVVAAGAGCLIDSLNPLVCYPGGMADSVVMRYKGSDGRPCGVDMTLRSTADRRYCYNLSDDLAPRTGKLASPVEVPTPSGGITRREGLLTVARADNPEVICAMTEVEGRVTAIVEATGGSTLDFGRRRGRVTTTAGIFSASVDSAVSRVKTELIDKRGVESGSCVSRGENRLLAIAGDDLVEIGEKRVSTIVRGVGGTALGSVRATGETWLLRQDGEAIVMTPGGQFYLRDDIAAVALHDTGVCTVAVDAAGNSYNLDVESEVTPPVEWRMRLPGERPRGYLSIDINGRRVNGRVTLSADRGSGTAAGMKVMTVSVNGSVAEPLKLRLPVMRRGWNTSVTIALDAVDPSFLFKEVGIGAY